MLLVLVIVAIPWAHATSLYHQTEVPKRVLADLGAGLIAGLVLLATRASREPNDRKILPRSRLSTMVFAGLVLHAIWQFMTAPFARTPAATLDTVMSSAMVVVWFWTVRELFLGTPILGRWVSGAATLAAGVCAALGHFQYAVLHPDAFPFASAPFAALRDRFAAGTLWGGIGSNIVQTDPPGSFFGHTNMAAEFVAAVIPISFWATARLVRSGLSEDRPSRIFGALIAALVTAIEVLFVVRSGSRAVILSLIVVAVIAWLFFVARSILRSPEGRARRLVLHAIVMCVLAGTIGGALAFVKVHPRHGQSEEPLWSRLVSAFDPANTTFRERLDLWANTASMIRTHPIFGVGPGNFRIVYPEYANTLRTHEAGRLSMSRQPEKPHNSYLEVVAENGWLGAAFFIAAILGAILLGLKTYLATPDASASDDGFAWAAALSMTVLCGAGMFAFPFQGTATRIYFWLAAAAISATADRAAGPHVFQSVRGRSLAIASLVVLCVLVFAHDRARVESSRSIAASRAIAGVSAAADDDKRLQEIEELRRLDQAVARTPTDDSFLVFRAEILRLDHRLDEAETGFRRALELHPHLINAWVGAAETALDRGDSDAAIVAATRAVAINPAEPRARVTLAAAFAQSGDRDRALAEYENALAQPADNPTRLQILVNLALLYDEMRDAASASKFLQDAETIAPKDAAVVLARARVTERSFPGTAQSFMAWSHVMEVDPTHVEAKVRVGLGFLAKEQALPALALFNEAYRLDPSAFFVLYHRAEALARLARFGEARDSLFECMKRCGMAAKNGDLFDRCRSMVELIDGVLRERAAKEASDESRPTSAPAATTRPS